MPSKRKKFNARFPPARIKKIMQTDEDIGKVAAPVPVIISRVLELFIESLVTKANVVTQDRNAKTLTPSHIKHVIISENKFDFLKDLVASVPDIHVDEEEDATIGESGPRPRGRPRKTNKEGIPRKRKPRKNRAKDNDVSHKSSVKKQCSEGSNTEEVDSDEDDDEETDDADEENVPIKHQSLKKDENNQNLKLMQTPVNHVQDTSSDQISRESKTTCYSAEPRLGEDSKLHPNNHQTTPCMSSTMDRMPCFDSRSPFPVVTGFHPSSPMIMPNSPHIPMPYPYPPPPSLPGMFPGMPPIVVNENDKDDDDDYDS